MRGHECQRLGRRVTSNEAEALPPSLRAELPSFFPFFYRVSRRLRQRRFRASLFFLQTSPRPAPVFVPTFFFGPVLYFSTSVMMVIIFFCFGRCCFSCKQCGDRDPSARTLLTGCIKWDVHYGTCQPVTASAAPFITVNVRRSN